MLNTRFSKAKLAIFGAYKTSHFQLFQLDPIGPPINLSFWTFLGPESHFWDPPFEWVPNPIFWTPKPHFLDPQTLQKGVQTLQSGVSDPPFLDPNWGFRTPPFRTPIGGSKTPQKCDFLPFCGFFRPPPVKSRKWTPPCSRTLLTAWFFYAS